MDDASAQLIQATPIFGGLHPELLAPLLDRASRVKVAEGEFFFREGSRGTSVFVLETGRVSILRHWDGRDHLLRHLEKGDCFGEVALLDFGLRSASVHAAENCSAIELTARDLLELSKQSPEQFALIYMNLARELSRRLRIADDRLFRARLAHDAIAEDYSFSAH